MYEQVEAAAPPVGIDVVGDTEGEPERFVVDGPSIGVPEPSRPLLGEVVDLLSLQEGLVLLAGVPIEGPRREAERVGLSGSKTTHTITPRADTHGSVR